LNNTQGDKEALIQQLNQTISEKDTQISVQKKIILEYKSDLNNYSLLTDNIKLLTTHSMLRHPLAKAKQYKKILKLFDKFKYKKNPQKKVFIFANCHGNIYKNVLSNADLHSDLNIEHLLSYENLSNYKSIKHKFSECDILIIQPVQNYEKFKMENLLPLLKKECTVIRMPFIRFNGYWDKDDVRELSKFKPPAVMFFPNITEIDESTQYIDGDLCDQSKVVSRFESAIDEMKDTEQQGDIKFVDFVLEHHTSIPLFRDAYHPTKTMYDFISHQLLETVRSTVPSLSKSSFSLPDTWNKEYGHFKPIDNITAKTLELKYDLDSYFTYSRSTYLKSILQHENRINAEIIVDLSNLTRILKNSDEGIAKIIRSLDIHDNYIAYNKDWQFPAITEQHAFIMIRDNDLYDKDSIYIAFPWATLIDLLHEKDDRSDLFLDVLTQIKKKIRGKKNIITVCQHINMLRYQNIFAEVGITDLFWTHAIKNQVTLPKYQEVKIHPFPLYPVQVNNRYDSYDEREFLYSFVGARAADFYLTQSRNYIIDILSEDIKGLILGRDTWHYNKIVYDHQIKKEVDSNTNLIDNSASVEFQDIVKKSIFSLCPSGSGPNSIRLWESIGFGAIPVILADTYLPPGNLELWDEAVVYCAETKEAIHALPNRLEEITKDPELLARKRQAMHQLWLIYGPDCFVHDIEKLFLSVDNTKQSR